MFQAPIESTMHLTRHSRETEPAETPVDTDSQTLTRIFIDNIEHAYLVDLTAEGDYRTFPMSDLNFIAGLQAYEVVARLGELNHFGEVGQA